MNTKRRWYELLLAGLVIPLVLASGHIQTANAVYDYIKGDPEYDDDESADYYYTNNSTYIEAAYANGDAT